MLELAKCGSFRQLDVPLRRLKSTAMSTGNAKRPLIIKPRPYSPFAARLIGDLKAILEQVQRAESFDSRKARDFQRLLDDVAGKELGDFDWNREAVLLINEIRACLDLDLFLDERLTTQISLGCIPPRPGFQHGRFDAKMSKLPQDKKYYKDFPKLFLGRRIHISPFDLKAS